MGREKKKKKKLCLRIYKNTWKNRIYIYIYLCVCVCVWKDENLRIGSKVRSPMLEKHTLEGTDSEPSGEI